MEEWTTVRYLHAQGKSIREISRELRLARQTVRRALVAESKPQYQRPPRPNPKLEPFKEQVRELYFGKQLIGSRILRELQAAGYQGGRTALYAYLRSLRQVPLADKVTVRFETPPGQQGQFDWSPYTVSLGGELRRVIVYGMTLGYSRRKHYTASLDERQGSIFEAIEESLWHFGGAPRELLVDNARAFVLDVSTTRFRWNPQFLELCGHYRIQPRACQPYRPRTKGKVERPFAYLEEQFIKGRDWRSLEHFLEELARFEAEDLDVRVHSTTRQAPLERFAEEAPLLTPLPAQRFIGTLTETRKVSWDCLVSYRGNRYSVPAVSAGKMVWLRVSQGRRLVILDSKRVLLAEHELCPGRGQLVMQPEHYELLRQRGSPRTYALLAERFLGRFPHHAAFLEGLTAQHKLSPAAPLRAILDLAELYPAARMVWAFAVAADYNSYSHSFIRGLLESGTGPEVSGPSPPEKVLPLPLVPVQSDLSRYQQVLEVAR